jgi:hypothetical protein
MTDFNHNPTGKGGFKPGISGNPLGRKPGRPHPKPTLARDIVSMAHRASPEAMQWVVDIAHGKIEAPQDMRLKAVQYVHARAYGTRATHVSMGPALGLA